MIFGDSCAQLMTTLAAVETTDMLPMLEENTSVLNRRMKLDASIRHSVDATWSCDERSRVLELDSKKTQFPVATEGAYVDENEDEDAPKRRWIQYEDAVPPEDEERRKQPGTQRIQRIQRNQQQ